LICPEKEVGTLPGLNDPPTVPLFELILEFWVVLSRQAAVMDELFVMVNAQLSLCVREEHLIN
jgi:hypothetical protein